MQARWRRRHFAGKQDDVIVGLPVNKWLEIENNFVTYHIVLLFTFLILNYKECIDFFNFASRYEIKNLITCSMKPLRGFIASDQVFDFLPRCKVQKISSFLKWSRNVLIERDVNWHRHIVFHQISFMFRFFQHDHTLIKLKYHLGLNFVCNKKLDSYLRFATSRNVTGGTNARSVTIECYTLFSSKTAVNV